MIKYGYDRWLTKNEYSRIRYKAKKMGATKINLSSIWHSVSFGYTSVSFVFKPFECHASINSGNLWKGHFSDKKGAEEIKKDMDKALEFMEYLKDFDKEIEKT